MKKLFYILYIVVITFVILEVGVRVLTKPNEAHVDLFMDLKHRYMLPLPTAHKQYYEEGIAETRADAYRVFDDSLGWSHAPWGWDTTGFPCYANDKGLRITQKAWQNRDSSQKHYDIITIGNSFTHGDAVQAEDTWPYMLSVKTGKSVANLGVGGYGLQQALLRLMFSGITADTVFFGAIWGDFERTVEPVYTFYQGGNKTRPMIAFAKNGEHSLANVPVMRPEDFYAAKAMHNHEIFSLIPGFDETVFSDALWTNSYFLRLVISIQHQKKYFQEKPVYLTEGEALEHCLNIFTLFKSYCQANNMYPVVLLLDTGQNYAHKQKWQLENPWQLVSNKLSALEIEHADLHQPLFEAYTQNRHNLIHPVENLHYSPAGNQLVADLIIAKYFSQSLNH
jgi:hypothetical protein